MWDEPPATWVCAAIGPLGTAVTEEVIFRGLLFAVWREAGAALLTAALGTAPTSVDSQG